MVNGFGIKLVAFKRIILLGVSILALISPIHSTTIDSLKKVFASQPKGNQKAITGSEIIYQYLSMYDSALIYATNYLELWKKDRNKFGEALTYYQIGFIALENAKYEESKELLNKGLSVCSEIGNDSLKAKIYMRLGFIYYTQADYETAIKTYHSAAAISKKINNPKITSWAYNLLGLAFRAGPIPDYKKALEYYFKALEIDKQFKPGRSTGMILLRIGSVYTVTDDYQKAHYYLNQSLRLADSLNIPTVKKWTLEAMASLYKRKKDYKQSILIERTSLQMSKVAQEKPGIIISYMNVADNYKYLKDFKLAELYADSALNVCIDSKVYQSIAMCYMLKSAICEGKGELAKAFAFYKKSISLKDSLFSLQNINNINDLETKYHTQEKEASIQLLNKQKESDERVKTVFRIALSISIILILGIVYFLINLIRSKKIIALQKLETEKQKDLVMEKQKDITDSINYALRIQEAILPSREISKEIFEDSFVLYKQKDIVSGDFYWHNVKNGKSIVTAVDCTGHGVPGALMSMLGVTFLNEIVNHMCITTPATILSELRDRVKDTLKQTGSEGESKDGMDMALISVDHKTLKLEFCGANNPLWIYRIENHNTELIEIEPDKRPVGYFRGLGIPFTNKEFQLKKGDRIYLFTDGFADQFGGPKGKKFKNKQLQGLLAVIAEESMTEQFKILSESFDNWKGNLEQVDDVCLIGLKV